jgi:hypothetical protein
VKAAVRYLLFANRCNLYIVIPARTRRGPRQAPILRLLGWESESRDLRFVV